MLNSYAIPFASKDIHYGTSRVDRGHIVTFDLAIDKNDVAMLHDYTHGRLSTAEAWSYEFAIDQMEFNACAPDGRTHFGYLFTFMPTAEDASVLIHHAQWDGGLVLELFQKETKICYSVDDAHSTLCGDFMIRWSEKEGDVTCEKCLAIIKEKPLIVDDDLIDAYNLGHMTEEEMMNHQVIRNATQEVK